MSTAVTSRQMNKSATLPLSVTKMVTLMPLIYIFLCNYIPKYWETKNYVQLFVVIVATIVLIAYLRLFLIHYTVKLFADDINMLGEDGFFFQLVIEVVMVTLLAIPFRMLDVYKKNET